MKDFLSMKEAAKFRIIENEENYLIEEYWEKATKIFTANVSKTMDFIRNECSDEEFYWLSEIFETIAKITQSMEFVKTLRERLSKVVPENYSQSNFRDEHMRKYVDYNEYVRSIQMEIDYAEGALKETEKC